MCMPPLMRSEVALALPVTIGGMPVWSVTLVSTCTRSPPMYHDSGSAFAVLSTAARHRPAPLASSFKLIVSSLGGYQSACSVTAACAAGNRSNMGEAHNRAVIRGGVMRPLTLSLLLLAGCASVTPESLQRMPIAQVCY